MIKHGVLTVILRLRAQNYVGAFWYEMRKIV